MIRNVSYSGEAFDDPQRLIERATKDLANVDYDTIIGTGLSGALVVPTLARALGKKWAIIRKPDDGAHTTEEFEGEIGKRWIFVDDFIATGNTRDRARRAVEHIAARYDAPTTQIGSWLYSERDHGFRQGWIPVRTQDELTGRLPCGCPGHSCQFS